ncbi:MAG: glycosyltransferase [Candidatus Methylomirabilales bacterium]
MKILFWISICLALYTYFGYPFILWISGKRRPRDVCKITISPSVSVIIAARNEAEKIRDKIENTLALNYSLSLLEVIVASDASDDGTDAMVRGYAGRGVRLVRSADRQGKEHAQGLAVAVSSADILVFTDAATMLEPDALDRLVENFADPSVGAVSTEDLLVDTAGVPTGEGLYVNYEMWVRRLESRFHSLVGLSGSCFAIRRELCGHWSPTLASDFMGAIQAARNGYRAVTDPSVRGTLTTVTSPRLEVHRKIRTFLRGITVLLVNLDLLNPLTHGRFAFQLISHKLLRFVSPLFLVALLTASGMLMGEGMYRLLFWGQVSFYGLGTLGLLLPSLQHSKLVRIPCYFTVVQMALIAAWGRYLRGHRQVAWEPSKRPRIAIAGHGPCAPQQTQSPTCRVLTALSPPSGKIKVCHLASGDLWAGAEVQLATLLTSLQKVSDLEISTILFNEGRLACELRDLGINTHVIPESLHHPLSILKQLGDYFKEHPVDILHTHKYKDNILGALSSVYRDIRHRVRTIHGLSEYYGGFQAMKAGIYGAIDNVVNRWFVDRILAVSFAMRSQIIKRFGAERVICIHNGIDIERIRTSGNGTELRRDLKLNGGEFLIGTMGRLTYVKGLQPFLRAARIIRSKRPTVKFLIAGDGPLKVPLQALAREYGLEKEVLFLGHRHDACEVLGLMDLFVLPSLSEGIPMVLLEALALARPVVASRVGGIPEVIEHRVSGILVTPGREEELAQNCIALMDDSGWAQRLGAAGRKRVEEEFSARFMAEKVAEVYRALVCNGEPR